MVPVNLPASLAPGQDGKTVFKARINVDKKEYNPHSKNPPELANNLITDLIKEFHGKQGPNHLVKGTGLDPGKIDSYN